MTAVKFLLKEEVDEINSEEHLEAPADPEALDRAGRRERKRPGGRGAGVRESWALEMGHGADEAPPPLPGIRRGAHPV